MKDIISLLGCFYYLFSICIAIIQGGFWWIVLNLFIPIAPIYILAEKFLKLI